MMPLWLGLWMALGVGLAVTAHAQDKPADAPEYAWGLGAGAGHTRNALGTANDEWVALRRYTSMGSVAVEGLQLKRFGLTDRALAVDAYPRLWDRAYANVRIQHASGATLYPGTSWRAELYQGVGSGWELAASHDYLGFASRVNIDGVAVGKYWGNFYARWRHQVVRSLGSSGNGNRLMVRYYYEGDADHYVEVNASSGRSDDFASTLVTPSKSDSRGLAWLHYLNKDWGLKASFSESKDTSSAGGRERSLNMGLTRRW